MKQTKNKTLLEQALEAPVYKNNASKLLDTDVAIAWLKGEVKSVQISRVIWPDNKATSTSTLLYCFLNRSLREAYRQGRIKIVE